MVCKQSKWASLKTDPEKYLTFEIKLYAGTGNTGHINISSKINTPFNTTDVIGMLMLMGLVMTTLVSEDKLRLSFETQSFASTSSNDAASNRYVVFMLPKSHEILTLMYRNVIEKMSAIS